jgi:DNA-binding MarR family transcriptional regulator
VDEIVCLDNYCPPKEYRGPRLSPAPTQPVSPAARKTVDSDEALEPSRVVGRLIKQVFASVLHSIDERMQPLGLTAMQWEPLALIYFENVDTVAALARQSHVNCGSMTRMLDRLETKELVRRRRSATDRRVVHLDLTPKGRKVARAILPLAVHALEDHLRGFKPAEVSVLTQLLGRMVANGSRPTDLDTQTDD